MNSPPPRAPPHLDAAGAKRDARVAAGRTWCPDQSAPPSPSSSMPLLQLTSLVHPWQKSWPFEQTVEPPHEQSCPAPGLPSSRSGHRGVVGAVAHLGLDHRVGLANELSPHAHDRALRARTELAGVARAAAEVVLVGLSVAVVVETVAESRRRGRSGSRRSGSAGRRSCRANKNAGYARRAAAAEYRDVVVGDAVAVVIPCRRTARRRPSCQPHSSFAPRHCISCRPCRRRAGRCRKPCRSRGRTHPRADCSRCRCRHKPPVWGWPRTHVPGCPPTHAGTSLMQAPTPRRGSGSPSSAVPLQS